MGRFRLTRNGAVYLSGKRIWIRKSGTETKFAGFGRDCDVFLWNKISSLKPIPVFDVSKCSEDRLDFLFAERSASVWGIFSSRALSDLLWTARFGEFPEQITQERLTNLRSVVSDLEQFSVCWAEYRRQFVDALLLRARGHMDQMEVYGEKMEAESSPKGKSRLRKAIDLQRRRGLEKLDLVEGWACFVPETVLLEFARYLVEREQRRSVHMRRYWREALLECQCLKCAEPSKFDLCSDTILLDYIMELTATAFKKSSVDVVGARKRSENKAVRLKWFNNG